jgi:hypothetical protein
MTIFGSKSEDRQRDPGFVDDGLQPNKWLFPRILGTFFVIPRIIGTFSVIPCFLRTFSDNGCNPRTYAPLS